MSDSTEKKQKPDHLYKPGQSGNPNGRPKGTRNQFSEDFIKTLAADFERYGLYPIARVRRKDPAAYLRVIASLVPKEHKLDGNITYERKLTDLELSQELVAILTEGEEGANSGLSEGLQTFVETLTGPTDGSTKH